jgi:hypothetical protein
MNSKQFKLLILVSIVIIGFGAFKLSRERSSWQESNKEIGGKVFGEFPLNEIAAITIKTASNEVEVAKSGDIWTVVNRGDYPANFDTISGLLRKVWELKELRNVKVGASQLAGLELVEPGKGMGSGTLLVFKDASGKEVHSLLLGKQHMQEGSANASPFGGGGYPDGRYILPDGQNDAIALVQEPFSDVRTSPADWLLKDFFKVAKAKSIEVTTTNSWKAQRETESGDWKLVGLKDGEILDTTKTSGFNYALSSPSFTDVLVGVEPIDVGLTTPKQVVITTFDGFTYTVDAGKKDGEDDYYIKVSVEANLPTERTPGEVETEEDKARLDKEFADAQATLKGKIEQEQALSKWIYQVSNYTLNSVLKERNELLKEPEPPKETAAEAGVPFTEPQKVTQ